MGIYSDSLINNSNPENYYVVLPVLYLPILQVNQLFHKSLFQILQSNLLIQIIGSDIVMESFLQSDFKLIEDELLKIDNDKEKIEEEV